MGAVKLIKMKRLTNRSRLEIVCDILACCLSPQKKMQVAYHVNLSYRQANYYLGILVARGLLAHDMRASLTDRGQRHLITTQEGRDTLQSLTGAVELLDSIFANSRNIRDVDSLASSI